MSGGTNNIRRPGYTPGGPGADRPGGQNVGGQYPMTPPQMVTGGPYGPGPGGVPPQWGQPGQFPPMNIPGLLAGGQPGQYGPNNSPGFPGYDNLPKNWQDEGYPWQDSNNPDATYNIIA